MAADIEEESSAGAARLRRGRKRKRGNDRRKLLKDDKVEVRSIEEGFLGSWHSGTVIVCKDHVRQVQYDYLLSDDGFQNLVDHVQVSPAIDGVGPTKGTPPNNHRNFIRPPPPPHEFGKWSVHYGQCVDVLYEDAWWEGVIFDHENGSEERAVFFPDMGDELKAKMDSLRITQDWDEVTGEWDPRGDWLFLELIEEIERECPVAISLKQIWYEVRVKKGFENLKDWTSLGRDAWKELILAVVFDYFKVTALEFARNVNSSWDVSSLELDGLNLDDFLKSKSSFGYPLEVVPFETINPVEEETNRGDDLDGRSDVNISTVSIAPEHEEVVKSPALSIVPSNPDELSRISSHNNWEVSSSTSPKMPKPRHLWRPASPDIAPEAEYFPDAIKEYIQTRPGYRCSNTLVLKTRKHISYLGWKIQYSKDDGKHGRVRYISPDNNKCYHSLRVVCQHLSQPDSQISSLVIEQPGHCQVAPREPSADNHVVIESEYCPQALLDYVSFWERNASNLKRDDKFQELKVRAMKHLCAVGWSFFYDLTWSRKEMQYRSPSDKICNNLLKACKKCIRDEGGKSRGQKINVDEDPTAENQPTDLVELGEVKVQGIRKQRRRRRKDHSFSKAEGTAALVKVTDDPNGTGSTRLLRSSKRARQAVVPSPSNSTPRTVLCWLIEKNVVLPRAKVYYQGQRDGRIFGEGRVTRDGIKCNCCQKIFSFRDFESHVGSTCKRPTGNLFLEDGKSLLECQLQLKKEICLRSLKVKSREGKCSRNQKNDHICSVCHYGGELVLCDQCPSSFHTSCLGLKEVPEGDWFCPSCCCRICGERGFNKDTERFTDNSTLNCHQCENQYHVGCLRRKGQFKLDCYPNENWFCNRRCEQIFRGLCKLLRKPIPLGVDNLTWTLLKHEPSENYNPNGSNIEELMEGYIKLHVALDVMHECFEPVKEPRTKRDLVEDVIFGRRSELNRLNFQGFYTVLLERNDELITAATLRVYGEKVAEVPLVATRFQYRRLGMCRILMNELEKKLTELGVERLVLPAVPSVLHTWTTSFGFSQMTEYERLQFLDHTFLDFQGTFMCQKLLTKTPSTKSSVFRQNRRKVCEDINRNDMIDFDGNSVVSEVCQADRVEKNGILDQRSVDITKVDGTNGSNDTTPLVIAVDRPTDQEHVVQCQSEITIECSVDGTNGSNCTAPLVIEMDRPTDQDHVQCQSEVTIECSVDGTNGSNYTAPLVIAMDRPTDQDHVKCQSEVTKECLVETAAADLRKEGENNNNDGLFKCYKRRRVSACLA